jgi:hypothetical protein
MKSSTVDRTYFMFVTPFLQCASTSRCMSSAKVLLQE